MARIRTVKPDFFLHDGMAALDPLDRLAFLGLLGQADREGRLKDRPARLKVQVLPYDDVDLDAVLQRLHDAGFILRYECAGNRYIQVLTFARHQRPHPKEAPSTIPPPGADRASQPGPCPVPAPSEAGAEQRPAEDRDGSHPEASHESTAPSPDPAPAQPGQGRTQVAPSTNPGTSQPAGGRKGREGRTDVTSPPDEPARRDTDPGGIGNTGPPRADEQAHQRPRTRLRPDVHPDVEALTEHLAASARTWKPDVKVDATSKRALAGMDGLLRIDGREPAKVRAVTSWLFGGGYEPDDPVKFDWRRNILSGASLRKSWDKLESLHDAVTNPEPQGEWIGR